MIHQPKPMLVLEVFQDARLKFQFDTPTDCFSCCWLRWLFGSVTHRYAGAGLGEELSHPRGREEVRPDAMRRSGYAHRVSWEAMLYRAAISRHIELVTDWSSNCVGKDPVSLSWGSRS